MGTGSSRSTARNTRSEEHTSELQSPDHLVCRLLLEKKKNKLNTRCQHRTTAPLSTVFLSIDCDVSSVFFFFFFNDTATTEIYTLSLHDALPIYPSSLAECHAAAAAVGYPCIVKPRVSDFWDGNRFLAEHGAQYEIGRAHV